MTVKIPGRKNAVTLVGIFGVVELVLLNGLLDSGMSSFLWDVSCGPFYNTPFRDITENSHVSNRRIWPRRQNRVRA